MIAALDNVKLLYFIVKDGNTCHDLELIYKTNTAAVSALLEFLFLWSCLHLL